MADQGAGISRPSRCAGLISGHDRGLHRESGRAAGSRFH
jgi:hypothetical protein